jgi:hypothetical protein
MFGLTGQALTMGIGTAMDAFGFFKQSGQASDAGDYNWQVAENNARVIDEEIKIATQKARFDVGELDRQTSMLTGRQVATMAASGLAIEAGTSTADVLEDTHMQAAIDKGLIMADLKINNWRRKEQQKNIISGGKMDRWYAGNKSDASMMDAASSLLSGGANLYDRWYKGKQVGVK